MEEMPKQTTGIENIRPIMTSIGNFETYDELKEKYPGLPNIDNDLGLSEATNVEWEIHGSALEKSGLLNAGEYTYVISKIDDTNKISKAYGGCTGVVASGLDNDTGHYISFLTHQDYADLKEEEIKLFTGHFEQRLRELKEKSVPGSIDAVVFGGDGNYDKTYTSTIKSLSDEIKKNIELDPVIISPKINGVYDNVYFDNNSRRLFLVRADETSSTVIFKGEEIDEKSNHWENSQ